MLDGFMKAWQSFSAYIVELLPQSPTLDSDAMQALSRYAGMINYFIPVGAFLTYFSALLTVVGAYYVVSVVLRWLKVIS